jgi:hypothetical protein
MTVGKLKQLLKDLPDNNAIVVTEGNRYLDFKITHIEDSTFVGVWEIRITDFETDNPWEE